MAIDVSKINVVLPEGVAKVGEISLKGNEAELVVVTSSVGSKEISASYDGGASKSTILTVTEATIFNTLVLEPADEVYCGEDVKLVATFSKTPILSEVAITPATGFTVKVEPAVVGNTVEATYTAPAVAAENNVFAVSFREGEPKEAIIDVVEKPAVMGAPTIDPASIRIGATTTMTIPFDKAPDATLLTLAVPNNVNQNGDPTVDGNNIVVTFTGASAGAAEIKATYGEQAEQGVTVTVVADAKVTSATAEPANCEVGDDVVITVEYDKAFVTGQDAIEIVMGEGLAEKVAYAENQDKTGGTMTVTAGQAGSLEVQFRLGGTTVTATIAVETPVEVQAVDVDPKSVENGQQATVKITL